MHGHALQLLFFGGRSTKAKKVFF